MTITNQQIQQMVKACFQRRLNWSYMNLKKFLKETGESIIWPEGGRQFADRMNQRIMEFKITLDYQNKKLHDCFVSLTFVDSDPEHIHWSLHKENGQLFFPIKYPKEEK
jgi:hypothetical protein